MGNGFPVAMDGQSLGLEKVGTDEEKRWEEPLNKGEALSLHLIEAAITAHRLSRLVEM